MRADGADPAPGNDDVSTTRAFGCQVRSTMFVF
jgi:hypothetical protein